MTEDLLPPPPSRPPADPIVVERAARVSADLMKFVRQVRSVSAPVRGKLQRDMRERLEAERRALLGSQAVLPESLRHYAITFTEVQWMLDAWITATERENDDQECRRDFIEVATRMLGETEVLRQPESAAAATAARPGWWSALTRGLRADSRSAQPLRPPQPALPDVLA